MSSKVKDRNLKLEADDFQMFPPDHAKKSVEKLLFESLDVSNTGLLSKTCLPAVLKKMGILEDDPRIQSTIKAIAELSDEFIDFDTFVSLIKNNSLLIQKVLQGNTVVPDFEALRQEIREIFEKTASLIEGKVADYIPQLGRVNPDQYGVSICTIDGQRFSLGNSNTYFCVQSASKPINYCLALEEHGEAHVHRFIGHEPSGRGFNELTLNDDGLPHNPMINAGAIMCCSLIKEDLDIADRFDAVLDSWAAMAGGNRVGFNNAVYLSERQTADRNFALGYFMREKKAFPKGSSLVDILEFYFQCCSIEATTEILSIVAGTLANGGICPTTGKSVLKPSTVKNCLSLMSSCGMYDFSGEFAFQIGLPAKSGVSGVIMVVVPNVMGICVWSPRIDNLGNSVRGIEFCQELVNRYNFHNFDSLIGTRNTKKDPRLQKNDSKIKGVIALCWAAAQGDLKELQHLVARGVDLNDADYDGRTALHLAASEGHRDIISYCLSHGVDVNPRDRWGGTPLADAYRHGHDEIVALLESNQGVR